MNTQEAYEAIRAWFSKEDAIFGVRWDEYDQEMQCVYRGEGNPESNMRCAVGCLLPNEMYSPNMESLAVHAVAKKHPKVAEFLDGIDGSFLDEAQHAHDGIAIATDRPDRNEAVRYNLNSFIERLDELAACYGLTVPQVATS